MAISSFSLASYKKSIDAVTRAASTKMSNTIKMP